MIETRDVLLNLSSMISSVSSVSIKRCIAGLDHYSGHSSDAGRQDGQVVAQFTNNSEVCGGLRLPLDHLEAGCMIKTIFFGSGMQGYPASVAQ